MIDRGLLISFAAMFAAVVGLARVMRPRLPRASGLISDASTGLFVGLAAGRLVAVLLDDPGALSRPRDLFIIRGGVEFWPGVAAGVLALAWTARKERSPVLAELADLAPYGLVAYAVYEATCLVRDGCFGPLSSAGLRPGGAGPVEFPVGLTVAALVIILAVVVRRLGGRSLGGALLAAVLGLAGVRSVAAIWLPRVGVQPSRPQIESIAIAVAAAALLVVVTARRRQSPTSAPVLGAVDDGAADGDRAGRIQE